MDAFHSEDENGLFSNQFNYTVEKDQRLREIIKTNSSDGRVQERLPLEL